MASAPAAVTSDSVLVPVSHDHLFYPGRRTGESVPTCQMHFNSGVWTYRIEPREQRHGSFGTSAKVTRHYRSDKVVSRLESITAHGIFEVQAAPTEGVDTTRSETGVVKLVPITRENPYRAFELEYHIAKLASDVKFGPALWSAMTCVARKGTGNTFLSRTMISMEEQKDADRDITVGMIHMDRMDPNAATIDDFSGSKVHYGELLLKVDQMHTHGIFHHDLFLKNVLLYPHGCRTEQEYWCNPRIADFGNAFPMEGMNRDHIKYKNVIAALDLATLLFGRYLKTGGYTDFLVKDEADLRVALHKIVGIPPKMLNVAQALRVGHAPSTSLKTISEMVAVVDLRPKDMKPVTHRALFYIVVLHMMPEILFSYLRTPGPDGQCALRSRLIWLYDTHTIDDQNEQREVREWIEQVCSPDTYARKLTELLPSLVESVPSSKFILEVLGLTRGTGGSAPQLPAQ